MVFAYKVQECSKNRQKKAHFLQTWPNREHGLMVELWLEEVVISCRKASKERVRGPGSGMVMSIGGCN